MLLRNFIIVCWAVFAAYWAATAASTKRTAQRQSWASRCWYLLLLVLAFALVFGAVPLDPLTRRIVPPSPAVEIIAAVLCAGGLILAIWARRAIGSNWSGIVTLKRDHELVTQDQDLKLLALVGAQRQCEQLKRSARRPVEDQPKHASPLRQRSKNAASYPPGPRLARQQQRGIDFRNPTPPTTVSRC